jgi:type I restriction enzyme S subunit
VNLGQYNRYSNYKPIELEWLADIPAHWNIQRLRTTVIDCVNGIWGNPPENNESDVVCVRVADFIRHKYRVDVTEPTYRSIERNDFIRRNLKQGDLLLEKSGGGEKQPVGAVMLFNHDIPAVCSNFIARMRVKKQYSSEFLTYLHAALYNWGLNVQSIKQTTGIQNLDQYAYLSEHVPIPPLPEQRAIAAFLDERTARIDALIAKQERLIELLEEKRNALISHVVTKGLDPDVEMKDSGVEWLGEIPAHWEAIQFKFITDISYGISLQLDRTETEGTPIISLPNVTKGGQLLLDDVPVTPLSNDQKDSFLLRRGDLLFNWRSGSPEHVGKTAYFDASGEYTHVSFLLRLRLNPEKYNPHYYHMFLNNLRSIGFFASSKNKVNKTYNQTELGRLKVMVPPLDEQNAIAKKLQEDTKRINALITKIQTAINRLKEYRTALISAAVTGKIDVRDQA